jgi:hypothetical protein
MSHRSIVSALAALVPVAAMALSGCAVQATPDETSHAPTVQPGETHAQKAGAFKPVASLKCDDGTALTVTLVNGATGVNMTVTVDRFGVPIAGPSSGTLLAVLSDNLAPGGPVPINVYAPAAPATLSSKFTFTNPGFAFVTQPASMDFTMTLSTAGVVTVTCNTTILAP